MYIGDLFRGGVYAGITTSFVDGIIWRCRRPCCGTSSRRACKAPGSGASPKAKVYPNGRDPNAVPGIDDPSRLDPRAIARPTKSRSEQTSRSFMIWSPNSRNKSKKRTRLPPSPSPWSKKPSKSKNSPSKLEISPRADSRTPLTVEPKCPPLPRPSGHGRFLHPLHVC